MRRYSKTTACSDFKTRVNIGQNIKKPREEKIIELSAVKSLVCQDAIIMMIYVKFIFDRFASNKCEKRSLTKNIQFR